MARPMRPTANNNIPEGALVEEDCVACLECPPDVCVLPCKHLCLCTKCVRALVAKHEKSKAARYPPCPLCREPIKEQVKIEHSVAVDRTIGQKKRDAIKVVMNEARRIVDIVEATGVRLKFASPIHKRNWESLYHLSRDLLEQVGWQPPAGRALMRFSFVLICAQDDNLWELTQGLLVEMHRDIVLTIEDELAGHDRILQMAMGDMRAMMQKHANDVLAMRETPAAARDRAVMVFNE